MHNYGRVSLGIVVSAIVCALSVASLAAQQKPPAAVPTIKTEPAQPIRSINGLDLYKEYCAVCHGIDGKGKGPAAVALKDPVPDLTLLEKTAKGKTYTISLENAITGKGKLIPAHGTVDMPIWGPAFNSIYGEGGARARVNNLVTYIQSLQVK